MGATAFMHPQSWMIVKELVLERAEEPTDTSNGLNATQLSIGLAVNNNKLCG